MLLFLISCKSSDQLSQPESQEQTPSTEEVTPASETPVQTQEDSAQIRREALTEVYKDELNEVYQTDANGIITYYILAQQRLYSGDYQNALVYINRAASIKENADILALKGSIYLGLGLIDNFVANWRQALELDSDVPIPPSPYIVQQLQQNGLIDENLRKSF